MYRKDDQNRTYREKYFTRKFLRIFLFCSSVFQIYNITNTIFIIFFLNVKWYRWKFNWKWNCFASIISFFFSFFFPHLKRSRFLISWARIFFSFVLPNGNKYTVACLCSQLQSCSSMLNACVVVIVRLLMLLLFFFHRYWFSWANGCGAICACAIVQCSFSF